MINIRDNFTREELYELIEQQRHAIEEANERFAAWGKERETLRENLKHHIELSASKSRVIDRLLIEREKLSELLKNARQVIVDYEPTVEKHSYIAFEGSVEDCSEIEVKP